MPGLSMSPRVRHGLELAARLALAGVFAFASLPKLADPVSLARDVENYHLLPAAWLGPIAIGLPILELVVALALLTGLHARGAALVALAMLLAFAGGMTQALVRGIDLDCGCFGRALTARVSALTVARNLALASLALPILLARRPTPHAPVPPPPEGPPAA